MKHLNLLSNIILFSAVIILFLLYYNLKTANQAENSKPLKPDTALVNSFSTTHFKIAFVNTDTLLNNYELYKYLQDKLAARQKSLEATLNQKSKQLQKEAALFQQKVRNNSFLSLESAQQQEQELYQKQQELMDMKDKLSNDLILEGQKMQKQLLDTVTLFLEEYNKQLGNTFIFNAASFLYSDNKYDITDTVVKLLNNRYRKSLNQVK